jgi:hypothetical protein
MLPACGRGCQSWHASRARSTCPIIDGFVSTPVIEQACYWRASLSAPAKNLQKALQKQLEELLPKH